MLDTTAKKDTWPDNALMIPYDEYTLDIGYTPAGFFAGATFEGNLRANPDSQTIIAAFTIVDDTVNDKLIVTLDDAITQQLEFEDRVYCSISYTIGGVRKTLTQGYLDVCDRGAL